MATPLHFTLVHSYAYVPVHYARASCAMIKRPRACNIQTSDLCARDCISIQYIFIERFRSYAWAPVHCTRAKCIMIKHPRACKYRAVTVVDIRLMCERLYLYTVHIHRKIPLIRVGTCALYTSKVYNDQAPTRVQIPSRYGGGEKRDFWTCLLTAVVRAWTRPGG